MNRTVQQITQKLSDLLPENEQYYRPDELRSWGFPTFVVRRIRIELQRNLEESLIIPKTDWANIQSEAVQNAWQKFVDAIRAEGRLPASYAKAVIETAVADVLDMLVQPRKNIPEVVFGADDKLTYQQVVNRSQSIVVYPHFSSLLTRYMQKKNLDTLSRQQCANIITEADKKITARYSPLNWAQMLEPLFKLMDSNIDTNLLRLFFEDKNMPRVARQFDLMDNSITRAELIEVLSSPDLLNFEGYEDDQANLFDVKPQKSSYRNKPKEPSIESESVELPEEEDEEPNWEEDSDELQNLFEEDRYEREDRSINVGLAESDTGEVESEVGEAEGEEAEDSLNAVFSQQEEQLEEMEEQKEPEPIEQGMWDEENDEEIELEEMEADENPSTGQEESQEQLDESPVETESSEEVREEDDVDEGKETPMWMRYMSDEQAEEYKREQQEETEDESETTGDENVDEDGFIDEPIIDLTQDEVSDKEIETLKNQLADDRELFVEEIFNGSERAYDEAVEEIAAYDSWRDVSKYIDKEIFKRNLVNMYSEPAVDFTDRLQGYFLDKQNRNR